jgi:hypothetical protein
MTKYIVISSVLIISLVIGVFAGYRTLQVPLRPIHYHANFAVFEDGKQVDFTKPSYMHISPCTDDGHESSDPKENVHLHDGIGNVVHVHAEGITWKTLFETLKYWDRLEAVEKNASLTDEGVAIYVDGKLETFSYLSQKVADNSHLLISIRNQYPSTDSAVLKREMDAVGDSAKDYDVGKLGVEKCGSTGDRSLLKRFRIAFDL